MNEAPKFHEMVKRAEAVASHCRALDLWSFKTDPPNDESLAFVAAADKYLEPFAKPVKNDHGETVCIGCGEILTGFKALLLSRGGFTWGLAHGEGFCAFCKWPGRAMHYAKDADDKDIFTLRNFVLQYHPDGVRPRETKKRSAA